MSEKLRVLVVDDELVARRRLTRLLESMPDVELVGAFERASELLAQLAEAEADVVLLDIQMPELSGLDAAALLAADTAPYVIFVTAHSEHALEAFEHGALDYLLKPVDPARLKRALDRARRTHGQRAPTAAVGFERLAVPTHKGVVLVEPTSIHSAVYDGQLVTLHLADRTLVSELSLSELEARLPDGTLLRVHRRYSLNLAHVDRLEPLEDGGYTAILSTGAQVPIARQAARMLRKRFGL